jgi:formiminotetrahydrofolate cyclodeaminase
MRSKETLAMSKLTDLTVTDLLETFASPAPTPGGGSAAALAGALGASLLMMVAALPRTRSGTDTDRAALDDVLRDLRHSRDHLASLVDQDSDAYEAVMRAYRLPKATEQDREARTAAIRAALHGATEVPIDVMRACHAAAREGITVARSGNPSAASDTGVAFELLHAALKGAASNAAVNLESLQDTGFSAGVEAEVQRLARAMDTALTEARQSLGPA